MPLFWFLAGSLTTLAALILVLPQLRRLPRFATLPALPWQASLAAILIVAATFGVHHWLESPQMTARSAASAAPAGNYGQRIRRCRQSVRERDRRIG